MIECLSHNTALHMAVIAALPIIGGLLSRWHGGGFIGGSPKILKAFLWSILFAFVSFAAHWGHAGWKIVAGIGLGVLAWCMVFKNTGHGGGMDLAHSIKEPGAGREPEKLEYLILWLHGKMPQYWYDFTLLAIIGTASTLLPAVAIGIIDPWAGIVVQLGGTIGKPVGYAIGHALADAGLIEDLPADLDHATAIGEALTGLIAYAALATATIMVIFQ